MNTLLRLLADLLLRFLRSVGGKVTPALCAQASIVREVSSGGGGDSLISGSALPAADRF